MRILQEIRVALRSLRKNSGFVTIAILTLALGIGANSAIFSVIYAVLLRPLPYSDPARLALLFQTNAIDAKQPFLLTDLELLKSRSRSFQDIAIYYKNTGFSRVTLTGAEPETVQGGFVSANLLTMIGVEPSVGRWFTSEEEAQREHVVVLSHDLWQRRFGINPAIAGRTLEIDGTPFQVIGVMPASFQFPARETEFWVPISTNRYWLDRSSGTGRARGFLARWNALARLRSGTSLKQAQSEMDVFAHSVAQRDPVNRGLGISAVPLQVEISRNNRLALYTLIAAVGFLLLICCANVAHLMLARGAQRAQEMAVRIALGARRIDVIRQFLTESLLLSIGAAICGVALASAAVPMLVHYGPRDVPRLEQASLDSTALAFTIAISVACAFLFGVAPAWKISRALPCQPLKSRSAGSGTRSGIRSILVAAEFALTVILLTGAGLLVRSLVAVESVDPGFKPEHVLTMRVALSRGATYPELLQRIATIPGVRSAGAIDGFFELNSFDRGPAPASDGRLRVWADWKSVRGDYFEAIGSPLSQGREFNPEDSANSRLVAIVDETLARRYWPGPDGTGTDAIGKQFRGFDARGKNDDPITVIGIARDIHTHGRDQSYTPHVFMPASETAGDPTPDLVIRTVGDPAKLAATIREMVRSLDRAAVISGVQTMEDQLSDQVAPRRFQTWLLMTFSGLALTLAGVGIYSVMHYVISQRTSEIGLRMALGARSGDVMRMLLREGLSLAGAGLLCGFAAARWLTGLLSAELYGVTPHDALTYSSVAIFMFAIAATAIFIPARRAASIDPLIALRHD